MVPTQVLPLNAQLEPIRKEIVIYHIDLKRFLPKTTHQPPIFRTLRIKVLPYDPKLLVLP